MGQGSAEAVGRRNGLGGTTGGFPGAYGSGEPRRLAFSAPATMDRGAITLSVRMGNTDTSHAPPNELDVGRCGWPNRRRSKSVAVHTISERVGAASVRHFVFNIERAVGYTSPISIGDGVAGGRTAMSRLVRFGGTLGEE